MILFFRQSTKVKPETQSVHFLCCLKVDLNYPHCRYIFELQDWKRRKNPTEEEK